MRHCIVEGAPSSGKTTLAEKLARRHGLQYVAPRPERTFDEVAKTLANLTEPTVFDTLHLTPMAAGAFNGEHVKLVNRWLRGTGSCLVMAMGRGNIELYRRSPWYEMLMRGDLFRNEQAWDFSCPFSPRMVEHRACPAGCIGSPSARVLFVGEQPNRPWDLPFFTACCSPKFLNDSIAKAGLFEDSCAFTNALDHEGDEHDLAAIAAGLPYLQRIVALGKVAEQHLTAAGLQYVALPHPQYWKRFRSSEPQEYVRMIKEAATCAA